MFSGGNMKYYYFYNSFAEEHEINFSELSEYLVKTDKYGNAGVFVVDDNNFKDFVAKSNIKNSFTPEVSLFQYTVKTDVGTS